MANRSALASYWIEATIGVLAVVILVYALFGTHRDSVQIAAPAPSTPQPRLPATRSQRGPAYTLDSITVGSTTLAGATAHVVRVPRGTPVALSGWALDDSHASLASAVFVSVGSRTTPATYGGDRPDVVTAFGHPADERSGFLATIGTARLSLGRHAVSIDVVQNDGRSYDVARDVVTFEVR